jgi:hypothetical protein
MTADEYVQREDFGKKGLVVTSFCAYMDAGKWRYCAIWEELAHEKRPGDPGLFRLAIG